MLKRKIESRIEEHYKTESPKALMIIGARQVGKTYIIDEFCKAHYENYIKIDFIDDPDYLSLFEGSNSAEEDLLRSYQVSCSGRHL